MLNALVTFLTVKFLFFDVNGQTDLIGVTSTIGPKIAQKFWANSFGPILKTRLVLKGRRTICLFPYLGLI